MKEWELGLSMKGNCVSYFFLKIQKFKFTLLFNFIYENTKEKHFIVKHGFFSVKQSRFLHSLILLICRWIHTKRFLYFKFKDFCKEMVRSFFSSIKRPMHMLRTGIQRTDVQRTDVRWTDVQRTDVQRTEVQRTESYKLPWGLAISASIRASSDNLS